MMYFLVFSPPKTFIMLSPGSLALSVKYAMGLQPLEFWLAGLRTARSSEKNRRAAGRICSAAVIARRSEQFLEIMSHRHRRFPMDGRQQPPPPTRPLPPATIFVNTQ